MKRQRLKGLARFLVGVSIVASALVPKPGSVAKNPLPATELHKAPNGFVVIDPGHNDMYPGVRYGGLQEKDIVLDVGLKLDSILRAHDFEVYMTRYDGSQMNKDGVDYNDDGEINYQDDVRARVPWAKRWQADYYIEIHADKVRRSKDRGTIVYISGVKREREWADGRKNYYPIESVTQFDSVSKAFAYDLSAAMQEVLDDTVYLRGFDAHNISQRPAQKNVVIELGFLSNYYDRRKMSTQEGRLEYAEAIAQYFKKKI